MFQGNAGNINKNLKHAVQDWEIEEALLHPRALRTKRMHVGGEERYELLGRARTSGSTYGSSILCDRMQRETH